MDCKVGIIGAMDVEVKHLKDRMDEKKVQTRAGMDFCEGKIGGVDVVVAQSGVGKVNAAACTQILADVYGVTHIINTGVGGSLDNRINIGDIVVSTDAVHHDMDVTNLGYKPGQVPQMKVFSFEADPELRAQAVKAVREAASDVEVFEGRVLSGDQFVHDDARKQQISQAFGGLCCEMEGVAIAQTSYLNGIPFVIIRAISDKADGSQSMLYPVFERKAAKHCAQITEYLISNYFAK